MWRRNCPNLVRLVRSFKRREHDNRPREQAVLSCMHAGNAVPLCSNVGPPIIPKSVFNSMHVAIRETFALMLVFNIPSMAHIKEPLPRICLRSPHKGRNDRVQKRQNPKPHETLPRRHHATCFALRGVYYMFLLVLHLPDLPIFVSPFNGA